MKVKMKLGDVLNLHHAIKQIIDDSETKIEPLFKFRLLGIMKSISPHIENFQIVRNEKIREYGKENEDGNIFIPSDDTEAITKFSDDLKSTINSDVFVNITKLKANDVFDKGVKADYLLGLYPIIEK